MRSDLPALIGGSPLRPEGPPKWPRPDPDVHAALAGATAAGAWGQYHGEHVCALEAELAAFHAVPHALTCASGTLAVEVALRALRVGPGDEVVMAAYDYEPNFLTVHALGAKPVLADVRPDNWQLDETKLGAAFGAQTKAVIASHLHGGLVNMRAVTEIAGAHKVGVVEDASQATGATVDGRPAGTWGDVGTLSFGGSKLVTAGRGGALLLREAPLFQRAKTHLHRGLQHWAPLSEVQAAALRPQVRKLPDAHAHREGRVQELLAALGPTPPAPPCGQGEQQHSRSANLGDVPLFCSSTRQGRAWAVGPPFCQLPLGRGAGGVVSSPAFYKLGFQYDPGAFGLPRELFVKALRAEGIAFDAGFNALHLG
ncbi:MAG: DegT/DnrJ/EryC1/StrS family aminotransferase, partial [Gemmata sp.]